MSKLSIPVAAVTLSGVPVDAVVSETDIQPGGVPGLPVESVRVVGVVTPAGDEYLFRGHVTGRFVHACDRCLEPADQPFDLEVLWAFRAGPLEEDARERITDAADDGRTDTAGFDGHEIDLAPQAWEEVVLATPAKLLCREDCAGLCPSCGANLNREPCGCREKDILENKGLAGLANLFPDLGPKPQDGGKEGRRRE